ncbi:hypothetical protein ACFQVD_26540 [Streptosporangium amethystogenes subsp. fukuiense]|uniref:Uncharacterized protein n=1 Tax=Streptosporangium amethystogenes subsp. fukuiense TaxID=698418 RepID=A0ABW2T6J1_9ACTN
MSDAINVTLTEDDDGLATFVITSDGAPLGLGAATVFAIVKPTQHVEDDALSAHRLEQGDGVTIVDAAAGTVRLDFPQVVMESPSTWFYKIRVTAGGKTRTAIWGWLTISDA